MADRARMMTALRNADAAGDTEAAKRIAAMIRALPAVEAQPEPVQERPSALYENLVGYGDIDTPGEIIGETIGQAGRGIVGGATALADMAMTRGAGPVNMEWGGDLSETPKITSMGAAASPFSDVAKPVTSAQPQSTMAKFGRTVGEMLPAAAVPMGGGTVLANTLKYGVGAGVASEAAGQLAEGTKYEPAARVAGALAGPLALSARSAPKAFTTGDDVLTGQADFLAKKGIQPTAGQAAGNETLKRLEGVTQPAPKQIEQFTKAAMESIGSSAPRATDDALRAARDTIVKQMDDAVAEVSIIPSRGMGSAADSIAKSYAQRVPVGQLTPRVRGIADEIVRASKSKNPKPFTLAQLKEWRSDVGRMTQSSDAPTREAAHALRKLIDGATDMALRSAGREADIATLAAARTKYRNYLAIEDVASRSGEAVAKGYISPQRLQSAVARTQGRGSYARGEGTELGQLARAGEGVLSSAPTVAAGAARNLPQLTSLGLGGAGYLLGGQSIPAAAAAMAAPVVGQGLLRSGPVQRVIANPNQALLDAAQGAARTSSGLLAQ